MTTTISANPGKNKHQHGVSIISENPSISSKANACKLGKTCDSISSDDESEGNARPNYVKKKKKKKKIGHKEKQLLTLTNNSKVRNCNKSY